MSNNSHNDEKKGWQSAVSDWSNDRTVFDMPWAKFMMWVFLLSDTFIFGIFLTAYMSVRMSTVDVWPNSSEVFALTIAG